ncbi:amino acid ABC transporter permease [Aliamphritea hakodatensis]|uniref:amino acid ABC transporter permease n=1 Tax=Aliamphritea hakodatensis TaxID=2895352 RepID=UPI0022FD7B1D|nr:amino acid ABC transporter permease [Aliamphritea hakodatensis]
MYDVLKVSMPFLLEGLINTIIISLLSIFFGSIAGVILGLIRTLSNKYIYAVVGTYIHFVRGMPVLIQLFIIYYILPTTGVWIFDLSGFAAAVLALSIYTSSYVAEIVRAAIMAVPVGQWEAAKAYGMSTFQSMRYVIVPQAYKLTLAPMAGVYVLIIKGTSIISVIGVAELMRYGQDAINRSPGHIMFVLGVVALMYFVYCYPILRSISWIEQWATKGKVFDEKKVNKAVEEPV